MHGRSTRRDEPPDESVYQASAILSPEPGTFGMLRMEHTVVAAQSRYEGAGTAKSLQH
jgi:hypothetical protein